LPSGSHASTRMVMMPNTQPRPIPPKQDQIWGP
jgi:hypothetical protein